MLRLPLVCTVIVVGLATYACANAERAEVMLNDIANMTRYSEDYTGIAKIDDSVMGVLRKVDRAQFVPVEQRQFAFANQPLGIGHGQTISQPFIVALMTHVLAVEKTDRVLEIGTGSGYQAAVLGELAEHVYTIEIVEALALQAQDLLQELEYSNVTVRVGDGWFGWPNEAPFDKIMVTAVAPKLPPDLIAQLKPGGKMVLPVGEWDGYQELVLVEKSDAGEVRQKVVLPVRFVPMTGAAREHE